MMAMRKRFLVVLLMTVCGIMVSGLWISCLEAADKIYKWKFVCDYPPSDIAMANSVPRLAKWVEKASNGRFKITVYSAGQLVSPTESFDNLKAGTFQLLHTCGPYHGGKVPVANPQFILPMGPQDQDDYWDLYSDYGVQDLMMKAYKPFGVRYLAPLPYSGANLISKKPVRRLEDIKGLKIRTVGLQASLWKEFGAGTVYIPGGEIYLALQTGVVDAATWSTTAVEVLNLGEVTKYMICGYPFPMGSSTSMPCGCLLANEKAFNELPNDLQEILIRCGWQHAIYTAQIMREWDNKFYFKGGEKKYGMEVLVLSKEDTEKMRKVAMDKIWPSVAAKDNLSKEYVEAVTHLLKDKGVIK